MQPPPIPRNVVRPRRSSQPLPPNRAAAVLKSCGLFSLAVTLGLGAVVGVAYVRLSHGPVSFKYMARAIERGINAELTGLEARLDDAQVALAPSGGFELRLTDLKLAEPGGDVVATVPEAAVELSKAALWSFKLVPSRIELIEPRIFLAYSKAGGLQLSFDRPAAEAIAPVGAPSQLRPAQSDSDRPGSHRSSVSYLKEANGRARAHAAQSAYLRQIGVRNAVLTFESEGARGELKILEGGIDLDPQDPSQLAILDATMASDQGPWKLSVLCDEPGSAKTVTVHVSASDLRPGALADAVPQLRPLKFVDAAVSATSTLLISDEGLVSSGKFNFKLAPGRLNLPATEAPVSLEGGEIGVSYDGNTQDFILEPSQIAWEGSKLGFKGQAHFEQSTDQAAAWLFELVSTSGALAGEGPSGAPLAIESGAVRGRLVPGGGEIRLDDVRFKAGSAEFTGKGILDTGGTTGGGGVRFEGRLTPASAPEVIALWPRAIASPVRTWIVEHVKRGYLKAGTIKFYSGSEARDVGAMATASGPVRFTLAAEIADAQALPLKWMPPVDTPRVLVQIENRSLDITVPDASVTLPGNHRIPLKSGHMTSDNLDAAVTTSELTFKSLSPLSPALALLDMSPLHVLKQTALAAESFDGKVEAQVKLSVPLIRDLDAKDVKIEAKAKIMEGRVKQLAGAYDVQAAAIAIDVTEAAIDAKGDMLVQGVPVKLGWQRILEQNGEKQPPLRLSANLDAADRAQLGIDINQLVQGEMPVDVLIEKGAQDETSVKIRADLTNADIAIESLAWHKAPGRQAAFQADIVKGKVHKYDLQNLRIAGDDLTVEGTASIGADNKLREITLSDVQLNVITRLSLQGVLKSDPGSDHAPVWQVKVKGANLDGRDLYRSLLTVGPGAEKAAKPGKPSAGLDVEADIDNVLGHGEVSMRALHLKMSRRADKVTALDAHGTLDGGAPVAIAMNAKAGEPRRLLADTTDAGQAVKMIGVYSNLQGGRGRLEVNVDAAGGAEKAGTLWVESFRVLGDPVVAEVLSSSPTFANEPGPQPKAHKQRGQQREVAEFDIMKVPFSIGYGQFVLRDAYMRGPLFGVSLSGKADFKVRTLNLGGTYVPLQGLNNLFGEVPLLGDLTSGPKKEGMFGITFAVQGSMAQPQVLVNPLSLVAPGFFREIFQMTNPNQQVIPREEKGPSAPVEKRVRASSPDLSEPERARPGSTPALPAPSTDGWSSQVAPSKASPR